jgi:hypothetical protein
LTVPAFVQLVGLEHDPFPLTPALSPRERENALQSLGEPMLGTFETPRCNPLSPRERGRVRGKWTLAGRTLRAWDLTLGHPSAIEFAA